MWRMGVEEWECGDVGVWKHRSGSVEGGNVEAEMWSGVWRGGSVGVGVWRVEVWRVKCGGWECGGVGRMEGGRVEGGSVEGGM